MDSEARDHHRAVWEESYTICDTCKVIYPCPVIRAKTRDENEMENNPYAERAHNAASVAEAHMFATMAVAYEQRTATLLQLMMWEPSARTTITPADAALHSQVERRLGLNEQGGSTHG